MGEGGSWTRRTPGDVDRNSNRVEGRCQKFSTLQPTFKLLGSLDGFFGSQFPLSLEWLGQA